MPRRKMWPLEPLPHVGLGGAENTAGGRALQNAATCFVSFID